LRWAGCGTRRCCSVTPGRRASVSRSFEDHERSHRSETFQPLFRDVLALCENGNEEIAYEMLWSGRAYNPDEAQRAREAKEKYAA
jgi:hypothetical protein